MLNKYSFMICALTVGFFGFAQPKNILLPKNSSNEEIKTDRFTTLFSFYITKEQEVYFEDKRLYYFDEISSSILEAKRKLPEVWLESFVRIYLYADAETRYQLIDAIKSEIANTEGQIVIYLKTGDNNNIAQVVPNRIFPSGEIRRETRILTLEGEKQKKAINEDWESVPPPPLPPIFPIDKLMYSLMFGNKDAVEKMLPDFSCDFITLVNKDTFLYKNVKYSFSDKDVFKTIIESTDLLLIFFDESLLYGEYIEAIQYIRKTYKLLGSSVLETKRFMEMTGALQELLKKNTIHILD